MSFEIKRATLQKPDTFLRYRVSGDGTPLKSAKLKPKEQLLIFQRGDQRAALSKRQMIYHHVAQGELAAEPYVITF